MDEKKSFQLSKHRILQAFKLVRTEHGGSGIDGVYFEEYEKNLKNNLYRLWDCVSYGSYIPKSIIGVEIPKKNGKTWLLGTQQ